MSSLVISGDTSGSVTLQAPSVSGSTVLTLPSTSGTVSTISGTATAGGVAYGNGIATAFTTVGTSGQYLSSGGSGAPTWVAAPSSSGGATVTNPMSANITLTSSSNKVQVLTPDAQSRRITLPDATTISVAGGPIFILQNTVPWYPVAVMDSSGTNVGWVVADYQSQVYLTSTSTATGNWVIKTGNASADAGIYPFDTPYYIANSSTVLYRNYCVALSTDLAVAGSSGGSTQTYGYSFLTQPYKTLNSSGSVSNTNTTSPSSYNYAFTSLSSSSIAFIYNDITNNQATVFVATFDATGYQTKGTELQLGSCDTPLYPTISTIDSTHFLVAYANGSSQAIAQIISVSGTTCTAGTATAPIYNTMGNDQVVVLSSTLAHLLRASSGTIYDLTLNTSTNTVTKNNNVVSGTAYGIAANSATSSIVFYNNGSSQLVAKVVTSSSGTPTLGTASGVIAGALNNISVSTVKQGIALITRTPPSPVSNFNPTSTFALVKVSSGIPVLSLNGTMPGTTTSPFTYYTFSNGLGVTPLSSGINGTLISFNYQKIAVVGGI
jgi:hypothetical protein